MVSFNEPGHSVSEPTNFLQLFNALPFMDMELGNHTKTNEIQKLDLAGIHVIELIAKEVNKTNTVSC